MVYTYILLSHTRYCFPTFCALCVLADSGTEKRSHIEHAILSIVSIRARMTAGGGLGVLSKLISLCSS